MLSGSAGPSDHSQFSAARFASFSGVWDVGASVAPTVSTLLWVERVLDADRAQWEADNLRNTTRQALVQLPASAVKGKFLNVSEPILPVPLHAHAEYFALMYAYPARPNTPQGLVYTTIPKYALHAGRQYCLCLILCLCGVCESASATQSIWRAPKRA
jgi:hypothetical protein